MVPGGPVGIDLGQGGGDHRRLDRPPDLLAGIPPAEHSQGDTEDAPATMPNRNAHSVRAGPSHTPIAITSFASPPR